MSSVILATTGALDELEQTINQLQNSTEACYEGFHSKIINIIGQLQNKKSEITASKMHWENEIQIWNSKLYDTDEDGNKTINQEAQEKLKDAEKKVAACGYMQQTNEDYLNAINESAKASVSNGISPERFCNAISFINNLKRNVCQYHLTMDNGLYDKFNSWKSNYGSAGPVVSNNPENGKRSLSTNGGISWHHVYNGETNFQRASRGATPYSSPDKAYNLRGSLLGTSYKPSTQSYNFYTQRHMEYWQRRARTFLNGNG